MSVRMSADARALLAAEVKLGRAKGAVADAMRQHMQGLAALRQSIIERDIAESELVQLVQLVNVIVDGRVK